MKRGLSGRPTINEVQDEIISEISALDSGMARYGYLTNLGREHLPDEGLRCEENLVAGCQANAWVLTSLNDERLDLDADSDSMLIRGLLVLVLRVLDGRSPAEAASADLYFLKQNDLLGSLSPTRSNGLVSILHRIEQFAIEADRK